jgi:endonuclease YncB( thermonuclease family)
MLAAAMIRFVVGIADGDTLTARCGTPESYGQVKVRLAAIDAPEKKQPFGQRSRQALTSLCFRQQARLERADTDRYGRTVANVECAGQDAGTAQVRGGWAWVYRQYAKGRGDLVRLEDAARAGRAGLWADAAPVAPGSSATGRRPRPRPMPAAA